MDMDTYIINIGIEVLRGINIKEALIQIYY